MIEHLNLLALKEDLSSVYGFYYLVIFSIVAHFILRRHEPTAFHYLYSQAGLFAIVRIISRLSYLRATSYLVAFNLLLGLQIVFYRSVWHDLRAFPGPKLAALTQTWILREAYIGGLRFTMKRLTDEYGDWVRIGPNELYTSSLEALGTIMGPKGWPKGLSYDSGLTKEDAGGDSLLTIKTLPEHATRRRIWVKAFTPKAIKGYLPSLETRLEQLMNVFDDHIEQEKDVDLCLQIGYFVYDTMCDMAFGAVGGTDLLLTQRDEHHILKQIGRVVRQVGIIRNMPWLTPVMNFWPNSQRREQLMFRKFTKSMFLRRWKQGLGKQIDVFHYLLGEDTETGTKLTVSELAADSTLVILTGADTTRTVLIALFLYLLKNLKCMKELQEELAASTDLSAPSLARLPYLNACLQEAMRLQPPSPSNLQRICPAGGAVIAGKRIPEGTKVRFSNYALQRDERYFDHPNDFRPERWLEKNMNQSNSEESYSKHDEKAFFAFLIGPGTCVAKSLAWMEMRLAVANILYNYDLALAPGFDPEAFERTWTDAYLLLIDEPLLVRFTPRSRSSQKIPCINRSNN